MSEEAYVRTDEEAPEEDRGGLRPRATRPNSRELPRSLPPRHPHSSSPPRVRQDGRARRGAARLVEQLGQPALEDGTAAPPLFSRFYGRVGALPDSRSSSSSRSSASSPGCAGSRRPASSARHQAEARAPSVPAGLRRASSAARAVAEFLRGPSFKVVVIGGHRGAFLLWSEGAGPDPRHLRRPGGPSGRAKILDNRESASSRRCARRGPWSSSAPTSSTTSLKWRGASGMTRREMKDELKQSRVRPPSSRPRIRSAQKGPARPSPQLTNVPQAQSSSPTRPLRRPASLPARPGGAGRCTAAVVREGRPTGWRSGIREIAEEGRRSDRGGSRPSPAPSTMPRGTDRFEPEGLTAPSAQVLYYVYRPRRRSAGRPLIGSGRAPANAHSRIAVFRVSPGQVAPA